jgi:hypothetical protein
LSKCRNEETIITVFFYPPKLLHIIDFFLSPIAIFKQIQKIDKPFYFFIGKIEKKTVLSGDEVAWKENYCTPKLVQATRKMWRWPFCQISPNLCKNCFMPSLPQIYSDERPKFVVMKIIEITAT